MDIYAPLLGGWSEAGILPEHDRDLVELGWVRSDGRHLNAEGAAQIADVLAAAGFEPSAPPRPLR